MIQKISRRVALRRYQEWLDNRTSAWTLSEVPRALPDMNSQMARILFDKHPEVREDKVLKPTEYGHSDLIPEEVKRPTD